MSLERSKEEIAEAIFFEAIGASVVEVIRDRAFQDRFVEAVEDTAYSMVRRYEDWPSGNYEADVLDLVRRWSTTLADEVRAYQPK